MKRHALGLRVLRWSGLAAGGGLLLQTGGCGIDPDLILQAVIQFATETAIFLTDNALAGLS